MPRTAREKSNTGIYHVMHRGIDKRDLFLKDYDFQKFIGYVQKAMEKNDFTVYAYCLMTNHIHLLLKNNTEAQELGDIIKKITIGYVQYHNNQYGRTGHLFQNRYRSEAVNNDSYFLTVLRYIHQNPVKAGIVKDIQSYKWSSYADYLNQNNSLIDTSFAIKFFKNMTDFVAFNKEQNNETCLDEDPQNKFTDDELKKYISSFVAISNLGNLDIESRDKILVNLKDLTGASNRQLSRVLNIGRGILDRVQK